MKKIYCDNSIRKKYQPPNISSKQIMEAKNIKQKLFEFTEIFKKIKNLNELINLEKDILNFIDKYFHHTDMNTRILISDFHNLHFTLLLKKDELISKIKKKVNKNSSDYDFYFENSSDNYIEGTNYIIYASDIDPLTPDQDLLSLCK